MTGQAWSLEPVAALPGWTSGVAVTPAGRVFVSAPQHDQPSPLPTVAELVDGRAHALGPAIADRLTSVQGLRAGPDETLYALDTGVRALTGIDRDRAALWLIDIDASTVLRRYAFPPDVALATTYLNDLTVDHRRGAAYIIDAGGDEPHGLIRLDLDTGASTRLLDDHPTVRAAASPAPGGIIVDGSALSPDEPIRIGATGITLDHDGHTLYWNRADELFSTPTNVLDHADQPTIDQAITSWPVRPFASDGLDAAPDGTILLTDLAHNGVERLDRRTGTYTPLINSPEISWPDGVAAAPDGSVYVTSSQIHRSIMFGPTDTRQPPFGVYRLRPPHPAIARDPPPGGACTPSLWDSSRTLPQIWGGGSRSGSRKDARAAAENRRSRE